MPSKEKNIYLESFITGLDERKNELRQKWLRGTPFHYFYVDDFLPSKMADSLLTHFPSAGQNNWTKTTYVHQRNKYQARLGFPEPINDFFDLIATPNFLKLISEITGINDLITDPKLFGEGGGK